MEERGGGGTELLPALGALYNTVSLTNRGTRAENSLVTQYSPFSSVVYNMAARARLGGLNRYNSSKGTLPYIATASVSVGGDDWANQVINNVVGEGGEDHHDNLEQERELAVEKKIGEKKRLFHTGRLLELKNLPDGATEQVCELFIS